MHKAESEPKKLHTVIKLNTRRKQWSAQLLVRELAEKESPNDRIMEDSDMEDDDVTIAGSETILAPDNLSPPFETPMDIPT